MRTNHVQKSLISIHKLVKAHAEAADDFNKATDAMHLMLGEHVKALGAAAEGDPSIQGYVGHLNKLCKAHQSGHGAGKMAHTAFHAAVKKALDGAALKAGVDLSIGNANSTEASNDTTHGGGNTTEPGEVEHGFKADGLTAKEQDALSKSLGCPTLFSKVQSLVNVRPNANLSKSTEGGWRPMPEPDHYNGHPATLSTFEQRKRDGSK